MSRLVNMVGQRFGRLLVLGPSAKRKHKKACWWSQCDCGNLHLVTGDCLRQGISRSCGCLKTELNRIRLKNYNYPTGENHPNWKGGRRVSQHGYVHVLDPTHHRASPHTGYVFEHIKVYEEAHNVVIPVGWSVHHINGNKTDNRAENLELWRKTHPAGQRVEEVVKDLVKVLGLDKLIEIASGDSKPNQAVKLFKKELEKLG